MAVAFLDGLFDQSSADAQAPSVAGDADAFNLGRQRPW